MRRLFDGLLGTVLPKEFADDLVGDLREGYEQRARRGRLPAARWWLAEVARVPYLRLWRQARRLRARGTRRELTWHGRGGVMVALELGVAARSLLKRPAYLVVAVLTLVASVGAATLVFSVLEGVVLRPLPYPDAARLYRVHGTNRAWLESEDELFRRAWNRQNVSRAMLATWRSSAPAVESMAAYAEALVRWDDDQAPTELEGAWVLTGFFQTLGLPPILGRAPTADELATGASVLAIGETLWASRYGRDPDVLGRTVVLDGRACTVVGVMPRSLAIPSDGAVWWAPLPEAFATGSRDLAVYRAVARLAPSVREADVSSQLESSVRALAESDAQYAGLGARLVPLRDEVIGNVKAGITFVFWTVVVVTLIACVNLTSLVVARTSRRRPELAMRAALGAGRASLVASALGETALVSMLGGGLGVMVCTLSVRPLARFLAATTPGFPRLDNVRVDLPVLAFSLFLTVATALLAGALPAWLASRRSPWEALQGVSRGRGGRGVRRTHRGLLLFEATLAVVLLVGAGLLTRSSLYVSNVDPGFDGGVAYLMVRPSTQRYETAAQAQAILQEVADRVAALPGVEEVGVTSTLPSAGRRSSLGLVWSEGGSMENASMVPTVAADPGYFSTLGIPVLEGRVFTGADRPDAEPMVVVSELLARRAFGDSMSVGRTLMIGAGTTIQGGRAVADRGIPARVVGVVGDVRQLALVMEPDPVVYRPLAQSRARDQFLVVRTRGIRTQVLTPARAAVSDVDPGLLVSEVGILRSANMKVLGPLRARTTLVVALAALAGFLILVGIHGVVSYVVSEGTHEIGVRMALGARGTGEASRLVGEALWPVSVGALAGLGAASLLAGVLERQDALYGVGRHDLATYAGVLVVTLAMAGLSAWLPARRAAAVDPVRVLSEE